MPIPTEFSTGRIDPRAAAREISLMIGETHTNVTKLRRRTLRTFSGIPESTVIAARGNFQIVQEGDSITPQLSGVVGKKAISINSGGGALGKKFGFPHALILSDGDVETAYYFNGAGRFGKLVSVEEGVVPPNTILGYRKKGRVIFASRMTPGDFECAKVAVTAMRDQVAQLLAA